MWIASRHGWFSACCATNPQTHLIDINQIMVRARMMDHLERLIAQFPDHLVGAKIFDSSHTDYRFRIVIGRERFMAVMAALAAEVDYQNFKSETARHQGHRGRRYIAALHEVWSVFNRLQPRPGSDEETGRSKRR